MSQAKISYLICSGYAGEVYNGVYGRQEDGKFYIDPQLQRIYLFSIGPEVNLEGISASVVEMEVEEALLPALKATLLQHAANRWEQAYQTQMHRYATSIARSALQKESEITAQHVRQIIQELGYDPSRPTAVAVDAHIRADVDDLRRSRNHDAVADDADHALNAHICEVTATEVLNAGRLQALRVSQPGAEDAAYPSSVDLDMSSDCVYDVVVRTTVDAHGTPEQAQQAVAMLSSLPPHFLLLQVKPSQADRILCVQRQADDHAEANDEDEEDDDDDSDDSLSWRTQGA